MSFMIVRSVSSQEIADCNHLQEHLRGAFDLKNNLRPGFPYLVDETTFEPVHPVLVYLLEASANGSRSIATAKNRVDHLYEFLLYIKVLALDWTSVRMPQITRYRDQLCGYVSPLTRQPLDEGTVSARVGTVFNFYEFAQEKGWIPPGSFPRTPPTRAGRQPTSYQQRSPSTAASKLAPTPGGTLIEFISTSDLKRIMDALGGPPGSVDRSRDWLVSLFCVTTAARISETLALTVPQILDFSLKLARDARAKLDLFETKGGEPRSIAVPAAVIQYFVLYIDGERAAAIAAGRLSGSIRKDHGCLFVNGIDCRPGFIGLPYRRKIAEEVFSAIQLSIGMVRSIKEYDPGSHAFVGYRERSRHVMHHLRHTWVVTQWHALQHLPQEDRWIRLQLQLGHKSHKTTANTYLRAVQTDEAQARESYSDVLKLIAGATL